MSHFIPVDDNDKLDEDKTAPVKHYSMVV